MHELPVTQSIINIAIEEAEKHGASKITSITLKVGELSGLVPDCLQYYFDIIGKDTKAKGAKLIIDRVPLSMECRDCNYKGLINLETYNCPECKSKNVAITGGREFYIDTMEVE